MGGGKEECIKNLEICGFENWDLSSSALYF